MASFVNFAKQFARERINKIDRKEVSLFVKDTTLFYLTLVFVGGGFVGSVTVCSGPSMLPTINNDGDVAIIDRFSPYVLGRAYRKGDVVVSICPNDPNKCKFLWLV